MRELISLLLWYLGLMVAMVTVIAAFIYIGKLIVACFYGRPKKSLALRIGLCIAVFNILNFFVGVSPMPLIGASALVSIMMFGVWLLLARSDGSPKAPLAASLGVCILVIGIIAIIEPEMSPETKTTQQAEQAEQERKEAAKLEQKKTEELAKIQRRQLEEAAKKAERTVKTIKEAEKENGELLAVPELDYNEVVRYPDKHTGNLYQFTVNVSRIKEKGNDVLIYGYEVGKHDEIHISYRKKPDDAQIFENMMVRVYGTYEGLEQPLNMSKPIINAKLIVMFGH